MKILLYFDWNGSRNQLKLLDKSVQEVCQETGILYEGLYGSMNEKWNYIWLFKADSYDQFLESAIKIKRPKAMEHHRIEALFPQQI